LTDLPLTERGPSNAHRFGDRLRDSPSRRKPDNWLRRKDPWEVARPNEKVEVRLNCSFEVRGGTLQAIPGRPSSLIGVPFDRPVVGYGGKTINTLRLWAAAAPDYFDFQGFSHGEFVGAVAETLEAESLTRVLYPDDSTSMGQGPRLVRSTFWSPAPWPTSCGDSGGPMPIGKHFPRRRPYSSTIHTPQWRSPS